MAERINIAEMRRQIREEREALEEIVASLSSEELQTPGLDGNWTVQDVLGHIIWWEQRVGQLVSDALGWDQEGPLVPRFEEGVPTDNAQQWVDTINERVYAYFKALPLDEVRQQFAESSDAVASLMGQLTEDDLRDTSALSQRLPRPARSIIADNTYEHYREHRLAIEEWLSRQEL